MGATTSLSGNGPVSVDEVRAAVEERVAKVAVRGMVSREDLRRLLREGGGSANGTDSGRTTASGTDKAPGLPPPPAPKAFTNRDIKDILALHGLLPDDPRVREIFQAFEETDGVRGGVTLEDFEHIRHRSVLISRALSGGLVVPDFEELRDDIRELYEKVRPLRSGANADYIPQLSEAHVDPEQFGVGICTIDGQRFNVGDTDTRFGIQSCSKAVSYCIAQQLLTADKVHQHVGVEPSGRPFNEMCLDHRANAEDKERMKTMSAEARAAFTPRPAVPHNPMINAGAIMTASLLFRDMPVADRFDCIMQTWADLCGCDEHSKPGQRPSFANSMYLSESATADRNFCLGYMMQEEGAFMPGTSLVEILNLYFMCCSIELSCSMMATVAATLANGGVNPLTGKRVFDQRVVKNTLSLMGSCGMYDYSGQFAFTMGFPAKSGVGGGILIVIPGVMGICTFSPRLDSIGNSVRGVAFCHALSERYSFHNYDSLLPGATAKKNPARSAHASTAEERVGYLLWGAASNDRTRVQHLLMAGCDVNAADYDKRTALHVAASCGHLDIVKYLCSNGANVDLLDRFGCKPVDDANREGHKHIAQFLALRRGATSLAGRSPSLVALGSRDGRSIETERILRAIEDVGVPRTDERVVEALKNFPKMINSSGFDKMVSEHPLVRRCLTGELVIRNFKDVERRFGEMYAASAAATGGHPSTVVEMLARKDPNLWAVSVCSADGQRMGFGDVKAEFTVQSCFKPVMYCVALEENSYTKVNQHVGREPSGLKVDEMVLDRRTSPPVPHNPFINAGAIMSCALVQSRLGDSEQRARYFLDNYWSRLIGCGQERVEYDREIFEAEALAGDRNRCLAYMMAEAKSYPKDVKTGRDLMENLDFYFKSCAVRQDAERLSVLAGTLANGGVCPVTGERVFERETVRDCLSLMYSCGMYDHSGAFAFSAGFPAKSGAAGALLVVIPDRMGICTFSPNLDGNGNSVRGLDFCTRLSETFNFHVYDRLPSGGSSAKLDPTFDGGSDTERQLGTLIEAASRGDLRSFILLHNLKGDALVNMGDYDLRTALHLAAAEGHEKIVEYVIQHASLALQPQDRWGTTPVQAARKAGHGRIARMLEDALAARAQDGRISGGGGSGKADAGDGNSSAAAATP